MSDKKAEEKKKRINMLYELEYLVLTNGNQQKIKKYRDELYNPGKNIIPFDHINYNKLKAEGLTKRKIASEMGISTSHLFNNTRYLDEKKA